MVLAPLLCTPPSTNAPIAPGQIAEHSKTYGDFVVIGLAGLNPTTTAFTVLVVISAAVVPVVQPVIPVKVILFKILPLLNFHIVAALFNVTPSSLKPVLAVTITVR